MFEHELLRFSQVYSIDREREPAIEFFLSISKWSGRIPFPVRFRVDAFQDHGRRTTVGGSNWIIQDDPSGNNIHQYPGRWNILNWCFNIQDHRVFQRYRNRIQLGQLSNDTPVDFEPPLRMIFLHMIQISPAGTKEASFIRRALRTRKL